MIKSVAVFDYYKIDEYEFALGINIKLQAVDKTLTDAEIKPDDVKVYIGETEINENNNINNL